MFVDTPGVGGHGQPHLSATLGLLPDADAMLMISDTSQEFTEPEMTFIRQAFEICPLATIVATKIDLYPHWREIVTHEIRRLWRHEVHIAWVRHTQQEFAEIIQRQFSQAADSVIDGCTASATFLRLTGDFFLGKAAGAMDFRQRPPGHTCI